MNITRRLQRSSRYLFLRFIRLQGDPLSLARGTAVGLFVGGTPTIPLHTVLIILFASICRGNLVAALLASLAISNPLTIVPQYFLAWRLGTAVTGIDLSWSRIREILAIFSGNDAFLNQLNAVSQLGGETVAVMMTGGLLLALPLAVAGYVTSYRFFRALRRQRYEKHILK